MKHLNKYDKFNEGKISQFILLGITKAIVVIQNIIKKIRGKYLEGLEFKDKSLDIKLQKDIVKCIDYIFFDTLKILIT